MGMQFLAGSLEIDAEPAHISTWEKLTRLLENLDGYCAYKIPVLGSPSSDDVPTFTVVTREYGVLLIDVVSEEIASVADDDGQYWRSKDNFIYSRDAVVEHYVDEIMSRFKRSKNLYNRKAGRKPLVPVDGLIVFAYNNAKDPVCDDVEETLMFPHAIGLDCESALQEALEREPWGGTEEQFGDILSLIEGTWDYGLHQKNRSEITDEFTVNSLIEKSLNRTFKQDQAQRQVSMQIPNGPQRIRGLAGTGKTVVLCLKAALAALRFREFKILYLFNTQSLYNLIERQIGDYYAKEAKSALPHDAIDILHAWGGRTSGAGLYSNTCDEYGIRPLTLADARANRANDSLEFIYRELLKNIKGKVRPVYDLVLIDEAQDFPTEVFELVYELTKDPKRIVVAYDDFQNLKSLKIRDFSELFGKNVDGEPNFPADALEGEYLGGIEKDFILPNCYRNPKHILMIAHGVALGVKRNGGVVDMLDNTSDWKALGYTVKSPQKASISAGDDVEIERPDSNSTNLLEALLTEHKKSGKNLVQVDTYQDRSEEAIGIVAKIQDLVENQGVKPHNIYVIALDTSKSESFLAEVRSGLNSKNINAISPGFIESSRFFYHEGSVVLTTPFKAKGNEANIVFVANSEQVAFDATFRKRNAFFVSVTRSRGWCYISGTAPRMETLETEIEGIKNEIPFFRFQRPPDEQIANRRLMLSKADSEMERNQEALKKIAEQDPELLKEFVQQIGFKLDGTQED